MYIKSKNVASQRMALAAERAVAALACRIPDPSLLRLFPRRPCGSSPLFDARHSCRCRLQPRRRQQASFSATHRRFFRRLDQKRWRSTGLNPLLRTWTRYRSLQRRHPDESRHHRTTMTGALPRAPARASSRWSIIAHQLLADLGRTGEGEFCRTSGFSLSSCRRG